MCDGWVPRVGRQVVKEEEKEKGERKEEEGSRQLWRVVSQQAAETGGGTVTIGQCLTGRSWTGWQAGRLLVLRETWL